MNNVETIKAKKEKVSFIGTVLKGSLIALSFSLIAILIFAFLLRIMTISDSAIKPINQVIKILSILVGVLVGLKKNRDMGLLRGLVIGCFYTIFAFVSFSILDGNFSFSISLINDLLFGSIAGAVCGVIAVNLRRK